MEKTLQDRTAARCGTALDFERACVTWQTKNGSIGHWRIVASAQNLDSPDESYVLASMVVAGNVYGTGCLPLSPAYTFQLIAGRDRHAILRDYGDRRRDSVEQNADRFANLAISTPTVTRPVVKPADLSEGAMPWPLSGVIHVASSALRNWALAFPILHLNRRATKGGAKFQVETGPVIIPAELIGNCEAVVQGGFALGYVFFNRLDRVDFALLQAPSSQMSGWASYSGFARLDEVEIIMLA